MKSIKSQIPNCITLLNLLSGATAVILSFHYNEMIGQLTACQWAFIFIGAAAVFDFCDGASARLLGAYSPLGKELDSLADLTSFGLAPSMLMYNTMVYYNDGNPFCPWAFVPLLIAAFGALRLARFNIDTRQTTSFIGLPIPSCAIFFIGFIGWIQSHAYPANWLTALITVAVALLMVSPIRMFSLKFKNFGLKDNFRRYVILIAAILFVTSNGVAGLAWTILLYILISAVGSKAEA